MLFPDYTIGTSSRHDTMQPKYFSYNKCNSKLTVPFLGIAILLLISLATPASSCTELEKTSLLQFLNELLEDTGLAKLWMEGTDPCKWEGVSCNRNGAVTNISLPSRGLEGRISPALGKLTRLEHLNLSYNSLSGGLPLGLVSSSSIIVLDVSFNQLKGDLNELPCPTPGQPLKVLNISSNKFTGQFSSIPWKGMKNLVALNASNNSLSGQLTGHFCNISPYLSVLELSHNKFSGSVSPGLSNCSMLRVLKAGHNNINGTLPDELFDATALECLSLPRNSLHGILDGTHVAKLNNLVILDLRENKFCGKIPDSIVQLKRLQELHFGCNNMSGELPSTLSNCTNLMTIDLERNNFSGELAKVNFSNLENLKTLHLLWNNFSGTIPESIYSCIKLTSLKLSSNNFHGQLSKGLWNLKSLSCLALTGNSFMNLTNTLQILKSSQNLTTLLIGLNFMNETMPDDDDIDGFENLQVLSLSKCSLLGKIPHWLSKLTNLQVLLLDANQLTGPIPDWMSSLNFLFYLDISNNSLTGEIPTRLTEMSMLKSEKTAEPLDPIVFKLPIYAGTPLRHRKANALPKVLNLGNNNLTGVIPPEVGLLKKIQFLNLSFNKLYGVIPQSICNLTNLLALDLSSNHLAGAIPTGLKNLNFLSEFNISFNDLEGPVPTAGQFCTFKNSSFGGNPKLCGPMLIHQCDSAEKGPAFTVSENEGGNKFIFTITFILFFGVGVLYDQIVLSRYFG